MPPSLTKFPQSSPNFKGIPTIFPKIFKGILSISPNPENPSGNLELNHKFIKI
jgi:hypothetical protein